jgi:hypothetical protein
MRLLTTSSGPVDAAETQRPPVVQLGGNQLDLPSQPRSDANRPSFVVGLLRLLLTAN